MERVNQLVTELLRIGQETGVDSAVQFVCGERASQVSNCGLEEADSKGIEGRVRRQTFLRREVTERLTKRCLLRCGCKRSPPTQRR